MPKPKHGGARRNAGRKSELPSETLFRCQVMLDEMTLRRLRVLGGGNVSRAIRDAARVAFDKYQSTDQPK